VIDFVEAWHVGDAILGVDLGALGSRDVPNLAGLARTHTLVGGHAVEDGARRERGVRTGRACRGRRVPTAVLWEPPARPHPASKTSKRAKTTASTCDVASIPRTRLTRSIGAPKLRRERPSSW